MLSFYHTGRLSLLLLSLLVLSACKPSVKSMRHIRLPEDRLSAIENETAEEEARACVEHYIQTGDARYATPKHGITLLHLAAMTHRLWLVEQLLAEGADPNARLLQGEEHAPGDTPAILAVSAGRIANNDDALLVVKALQAAGADINIPGYEDGSVLSECYEGPDSYDLPEYADRLHDGETMALELMKLGARGNTEAARHFIIEAWPEALARLLNSPEGEQVCRELPQLLASSVFFFRGDAAQLACAALLLEQAEEVNVQLEGGMSPLYNLIRFTSHTHLMEEPRRQRYVDYILMLLEKRANPYLPAGDFGHGCAADFLQVHPQLQEALSEQGYIIPAPLHEFAAETLVEQLHDIPAPAVDACEAQQQFDTLALLFTQPSEAMLAHGIRYRKACVKALSLLHRADAARAEALLQTLPLWKDTALWEGEAHAARGLLLALQQNPNVALPAEQLLNTARLLHDAGKPALAHAIANLLSRDAAAAPLVERLCEDESTPLPIRAAAWSCRVQFASLPAQGEIVQWSKGKSTYRHSELTICELAEYSMNGQSRPEQALYPERLAFETTDSEREPHEGACRALQKMGAPLAASLVGGEAAPANLPAELADCLQRHGIVTAASFEFEIALSRHILLHRELFRKVEADEAAEEAEEAPHYVE